MSGLSETGKHLSDLSLAAYARGDEQLAATWRISVELDRIAVELGRANEMLERLAYPMLYLETPKEGE